MLVNGIEENKARNVVLVSFLNRQKQGDQLGGRCHNPGETDDGELDHNDSNADSEKWSDLDRS